VPHILRNEQYAIWLASILKFKIAGFIKSTNIKHNAVNGLIDPEYVGLPAEIKCLCRLEQDLYGKTYIISRHFEIKICRQTEIENKMETLLFRLSAS
jgi:hypothetical protein